MDCSITRTFELGSDSNLQLGLVGYNQWQTTAKTGPTITPQQSAERYKVNALGGAASLSISKHKLSAGFKYFKEFSNRSTFEGYSIQFNASFHF